MKSRFLKLFAAITLSLLAHASYASLLGDSIHAEYRFPTADQTYSNLGTATVGGSGATFDGMGYFDILVTGSKIVADYKSQATWSTASFNGFVLTDLTKLFPSVSLNAATNLAGFDASRFYVNGNSIFVNWNGLSFNQNSQVVFDVQSTGVPEPLTLSLLAIGLLGIGATRRRKQ
jgi:hypothetical protein